MSDEQVICRCGNPAQENDTLCAKCRYYQNVFSPPRDVFESKREKAIEAIRVRKMMKGVRMVSVE